MKIIEDHHITSYAALRNMIRDRGIWSSFWYYHCKHSVACAMTLIIQMFVSPWVLSLVLLAAWFICLVSHATMGRNIVQDECTRHEKEGYSTLWGFLWSERFIEIRLALWSFLFPSLCEARLRSDTSIPRDKVSLSHGVSRRNVSRKLNPCGTNVCRVSYL